MARIPEYELERLKRTVNLTALVEAAGVVLRPHGAERIGLCPFHDDHEPSLVISADKNLWHCLGACQCGGSVIDWVMKWNGVSFRHAVELLRADPALAAAAKRPLKISGVRRLPSPVAPDADDQALLNQVIDYYHDTLTQSPEALAYLEKRGLNNAEMIERFKLGVANRTLGLRLPVTATKAGSHIRGQLQRLGLLRESGHEHFAGSLVIPVFDARGHVTDIYGRKIRDDLRAGTPRHLYLPGPHQGVWNLDALPASREIILCEALIDALTFWCAGYRNVTAAYGVEGFTAAHLAAVKTHGTERVLIAYDRDAAGEAAAQRLAVQLMAVGIDCYRLHFPKGMDANAYALAVQPAAKSLGVVIRAAVWLGKGDNAPDAPARVTEEPAPPVAAERHTPATVSLAASPVAPPMADIDALVQGDDIVIRLGDRRYRVRGLQKNLSLEALKVNVLVSRGDAFHVDTLELYNARARATYVNQVAKELATEDDVIKRDLGKVLLKLEELQEAHLQKTLVPANKIPTLSESEQDAALDLLLDPALLDRLLADFDACGVVGEATNKLIAYLAATSRKLDHPLAVIVRSSSAAGKSALMEAVLALMPDEDKVQYSAMTGQSLFYMGGLNLKHKILALAEEAGAARASYALKLLQSEGVLTIASTGKDPETGKLVTHEYRVEGPTMLFSTTTAIAHDEELLNRCLTLGVDESREQTRAIHALQRAQRTLEGLIAKQDKQRLLALHRNAQCLLRPLAVMNPYAHALTFPDETTRLRRDHEKYLTLIDSLALLHQYQRPVKTRVRDGETLEYIEVTLDDIATANRLAHEALGRSLDELAPQTRRLLMCLDAMVRAACATLKMTRSDYRFSRRDVRVHNGWGDTQLRLHLDRLVDLEYLLVHRGGRGQSFVYELCYDGQGQDGAPFVPGLIDIAQLRAATTTERSRGVAGGFAGSSPPQRGVNTGGVRCDEDAANPLNQATECPLDGAHGETARLYHPRAARSYGVPDRRTVPALVATPLAVE